MTTAIVCIALLAALLFALGFNVSRLRGSAKDQFPSSPADPLFVAVRAHGNASEYVPTLAVLMLLIGLRNPAAWMIGVIVAGTAARYVHAFAILQTGDMSRNTVLRMVGAVGTYAAGLALAAAAFVVI